jgi:LPXTG-site transpeptidase (sortase) family protein
MPLAATSACWSTACVEGGGLRLGGRHDEQFTKPQSGQWGTPTVVFWGALLTLLILLSGCSHQAAASSLVASPEAPQPTIIPSPPRPTATALARATATPMPASLIAPRVGPLTPPYPAPSAEARLVIASVGVEAPLTPVGVTAEGEVESPSNGKAVGWYNLSPTPGGRGNSILVGHVDWRGSPAVFWRLRETRPGDVIEIREGNTVTAKYKVEWVQSFHINAAPLDTIFDSTREGNLTLITCEGTFDLATHNYQHRLVVRANQVTS